MAGKTRLEALTVVGVHSLNFLFCLVLSEYHCLKLGSDREGMRHYYLTQTSGPRSGLGAASFHTYTFSGLVQLHPRLLIRLHLLGNDFSCTGRKSKSYSDIPFINIGVNNLGPPKPLITEVRKCTEIQYNTIQWCVRTFSKNNKIPG